MYERSQSSKSLKSQLQQPNRRKSVRALQHPLARKLLTAVWQRVIAVRSEKENRQLALAEIIDTERTYYNALSILINVRTVSPLPLSPLHPPCSPLQLFAGDSL
jgi:hypothetical protein